MGDRRKATRTFATKTREGCNTCKRRRIRCDLRKPLCEHCETGGRQCEYSPIPVRPSPEPVKIVHYRPKDPTIPRQPAGPFQGKSNVRAFDVFRYGIADSLGRLSGSNLWTHLVLQAAHSEPTVQKAIEAVSCGYEQRTKTSDSRLSTSTTNEAVLLKYNKAISSMRQEIQSNKLAVETVLIICLLLICFEMLQRNFESAIRHMTSGIHIYLDWYAKRDIEGQPASHSWDLHSCDLHKQLNLIYRRLYCQLLLFVDSTLLQYRMVTPTHSPSAPTIPYEFESVFEARECFDDCLSFVIHDGLRTQGPNSNGNGEESIGEHSVRAKLRPPNSPMDQMFRTFKAFMSQRGATLSMEEQLAAIMIEAQCRVMLILSSVDRLHQEDKYDSFDQEFTRILQLASRVLDPDSELRDLHCRPLCPSFDMGIIGPLYFVATRCRTHSIRREALRLLASGPEQEGIWYNRLLHGLAEGVVSLENTGREDGRSSDIVPNASRVVVLNAAINSANRTVTAELYRKDDENADPLEKSHIIYKQLKY